MATVSLQVLLFLVVKDLLVFCLDKAKPNLTVEEYNIS